MINFDQLKETIKERNDIVELINSYLPLKRAGVNYKALCPFHSEKTPSFTVNPTKQIFYCFGCQKGGDVIHFVMEHEGIDFMGALRILASRAGVLFPDPGEFNKPNQKISGSEKIRKDLIYELHEKLAGWYQQNLRSSAGKAPLAYIKARGLNDDILVKFRLGYAHDSWRCTLNWSKTHDYHPDLLKQAGIVTVKNETDPISKAYDRFRNRLMFPIWNEQGRIIAFSGRALGNDTAGAKYINSPETSIFHKGKILYGLHLAREGIRKREFVLLCEGQMDIIACHQAGFTNAVASLGTSFTNEQARLLKRYTDTVALIFDADAAGINAVLKSAAVLLAAELTPKVISLTEGEDPDSVIQKAGIKALEDKIDNAEDYFVFRMNLEANRNNISTPEGQAKAVISTLQDVALLRSAVMREKYCGMLADRVRVKQELILQELNRIVTARKRNSRTGSDQSNSQLESKLKHGNTVNGTSKAELALLGIVIHHNAYALRLLEDLPVEFISHTPVGQALNTALAHTEQGEWKEIESILLKTLSENQCKEVNKALFDPEFGPNTEGKNLRKAYADCLYGGIILPKIEEKMNGLQLRLKSCSSKEEKTEILRKIGRLRKEKTGFNYKLKENSSRA